MNKIKNSKGFTLMEMLIVVAIIAILVAIAIPTFNNSLNKARVATDEANIRAGYANVMADILLNQMEVGTTNDGADATYTLLVDGTVKKDGATPVPTTAEYTTKGAPDADVSVGGINVTKWEKNQKVTYKYTASNNSIAITVGTVQAGG